MSARTLNQRTIVVAVVLAVGVLVVAFLFDLFAGPSGFSVPDDVTLPLRARRGVLAMLVGAALATSGAALQALLRNVLAEPFVIGVSGGAALGGAVPIAFATTTSALFVPLSAVVGALLSSVILAAFLARDRAAESHRTLLIGIALNAFAASIITVIKSVIPAERAASLLFWLVGTIGYVDDTTLAIVAVFVVVAVLTLIGCAGSLELMALGAAEAKRLGVPVERVRLIAYLACSLAVGAVVPVSGLIGFIGVVVPHALRLTVVADLRLLMVLSAILGAGALAVVDGMSRLSFALVSTEIPVGALTALVGAPFFALALVRDLDRTRS